MGRKKLDPNTSTKRAQILKSAGKMFVKQGYNAVSMDAIADAVPVSKRTLYNHFNDKKALFIAVMENRCQQVFQMLEQQLMDDCDVERVLTEAGGKYMDLVLDLDTIDIYRTIITQSPQFPDLGKLFYDCGPKRSGVRIAEYLQRQHMKGTLNVPQPDVASELFIGMLLNRMQLQCLVGIRTQVTPQERRDMLAYCVRIFLQAHQVSHS